MKNKSTLIVDHVLKWFSLLYGFMIVISFGCNHVYFKKFGITISDYLDLSEIILLNSRSFLEYFSNIILGYFIGFIISDATFHLISFISKKVTKVLKLKNPFRLSLFQFIITIFIATFFVSYKKLAFDNLFSFFFGVIAALVVSRLEGGKVVRYYLLVSFIIYAYLIIQINPDSRFNRMYEQERVDLYYLENGKVIKTGKKFKLIGKSYNYLFFVDCDKNKNVILRRGKVVKRVLESSIEFP